MAFGPKTFKYQKGNFAGFKYPENFHTKLIISNKPIIPELIKHLQIKLGATNYLVTRPVNRLKFVSKLKRKHLLIVGSFRKVGNTKIQILFQKQNYTYSRIQIEYNTLCPMITLDTPCTLDLRKKLLCVNTFFP